LYTRNNCKITGEGAIAWYGGRAGSHHLGSQLAHQLDATKSLPPETHQFTPFLAFPRKIIYTTNAIESLNARFRQATRRRGHFPTEQAALKVLYLVIRRPHKNRANVTGKTPGSKAALNALSLYYGDRTCGTALWTHDLFGVNAVPGGSTAVVWC
jgi:CII-binding regulator of phage lambda lysogenization HflD